MNKIVLYFAVILGFSVSLPLSAQVLDDDFPAEENVVAVEDQDNEHEELFDEMFGGHVDELPQNGKSSNVIEEIAKNVVVKVGDKEFKSDKKVVDNTQSSALDGELFIGVSQGSFKLFKDMMGRTKCSFGVTLKSTLNKDLRMLALRLIFKHGAYAFIFTKLKAGKSDEHFITTMGDICYNLEGVPDIEINKCRIMGAREDDCMQRLKWDDKILSPNPSVDRNY
ncbi:MAG: hypothetical protein IJZ30_06345 [Alphaproteobacteria bacterium]|nr:hypothetical protein [Alphaproteobacteria bacterium]